MITTAEAALAELVASREPQHADVVLRDMPVTELVALLRSAYHEARFLALLGMVEQYRRGSAESQERLYRAYLANTASLDRFLERNYRRMPRTMLRYAIEKHAPARRHQYLRGEVEPDRHVPEGIT